MDPVPVKKMPAFIAHLLMLNGFLRFQENFESLFAKRSTTKRLNDRESSGDNPGEIVRHEALVRNEI
jgi:hypothetical protein